jgi:RNA polymerase-interacting CarD/CdnL/TRCF family regulator
MELNIGDYICYGAHGVCQVCGLEAKALGTGSKNYFLLRPKGNEKIMLYLPEDAQPDRVKVRRLLTRQELLDLLHGVQPEAWISDSKRRHSAFTRVLGEGDPKALLTMIRTIISHQQQMEKPLSMSDQEMLQAARRQIYGEMTYVLALEESQILPFLRRELSDSMEFDSLVKL